ncbi:hypothetical protein [Micromonospora chalcea]|uniref:hypothetical protein n=1 Tax=Micromonospora chalcea TaxID=1874 RepID=UPI003D713179
MVNSPSTGRTPSGAGNSQSSRGRSPSAYTSRPPVKRTRRPSRRSRDTTPEATVPAVGCQLLSPYATCASSAAVQSRIAAVTSRSPSPPKNAIAGTTATPAASARSAWCANVSRFASISAATST